MSVQSDLLSFFAPKIPKDDRRATLQKIAETTLDAIAEGGYFLDNDDDDFHDLETKIKHSKRRTRYFAPDSLLSTWASTSPKSNPSAQQTGTEISILEISTLDGARLLADIRDPDHHKIGILNFASARKPGGGFINGAQAQEESIARSSTLYPTLMTSTAQNFYTLHNNNTKGGYYSHAMVYSPGVVVFRDDVGGWTEPLMVDVITSPAVNAGEIRKNLSSSDGRTTEEDRIKRVMRERMARILFLFEKENIRKVVLGSFGTGVFQNDVDVVGNIWADLLAIKGARFNKSFDHVVFAILGRKTFAEFETAFQNRTKRSYAT